MSASGLDDGGRRRFEQLEVSKDEKRMPTRSNNQQLLLWTLQLCPTKNENKKTRGLIRYTNRKQSVIISRICVTFVTCENELDYAD